jgi:hypothetical protein
MEIFLCATGDEIPNHRLNLFIYFHGSPHNFFTRPRLLSQLNKYADHLTSSTHSGEENFVSRTNNSDGSQHSFGSYNLHNSQTSQFSNTGQHTSQCSRFSGLSNSHGPNNSLGSDTKSENSHTQRDMKNIQNNLSIALEA